MRLSPATLVLCAMLALVAAPASASPQPMDVATMGNQQYLPDTVTADGMHVGSWSAGNWKKPGAQAAAPAAAQTAGQAAARPAASAPQVQAPMQTWTAGPAAQDGDNALPASHSMVVTSIQSCYDQLDPADVADIKRNYDKPYEECQARLQAKLAGKRDLKQGEIQNAAIPETPRNYQRVTPPDQAAGTP